MSAIREALAELVACAEDPEQFDFARLKRGVDAASEALAAQPAQALPETELRSLIERECGPVQRIGDMLWAVEVARAVERAHGIGEQA